MKVYQTYSLRHDIFH